MAKKAKSRIRLASDPGMFPARFERYLPLPGDWGTYDPRIMSWAEIRRATVLAFEHDPSFDKSALAGLRRADLERMLLDGKLPARVTAPAPEPGPEPTVTVPRSGDGLDAIRDILGIHAVDRETVRAEIDKALAPVLAELDKAIADKARTVTVHPPAPAPAVTHERVHSAFDEALAWLSLGVPVILWGPEGTGKSTLQAQLAESMGAARDDVHWYPPLTVDNERADILGFERVDGSYSGSPAYHAIRTTDRPSAIVVEEIDGGNENTSVALNQIAENGHVSFPNGETLRKTADTYLVCSANTPGYGPTAAFSGRNRLDRATRSRFAFVYVGIDEALETALVNDAADGVFTSRQIDEDTARARRAEIAVMLADVRRWRKSADALGETDLSLSPRATVKMGLALAAGMDREKAEDAAIWAGIDPETRTRVKAGAA